MSLLLQSSAELLLEEVPSGTRYLLSAIIETKTFRRLVGISFLGAISKLPRNGKAIVSGSRYDHSIGVAKIVLDLSAHTNVSHHDARLGLLHALLHDVGHGPYSHSSEPFFSISFGLDHHAALLKIVDDENSDVSQILRKFNLWCEYRSFIANPSANPTVSSFFYGPINADTIEGIVRSAVSFGVKTDLTKKKVVDSLRSNAMNYAVLDEFWRLKSIIYNEYIYSRPFASQDQAFTRRLFSVRHRLEKSHFFCDDDAFDNEVGPGGVGCLDVPENLHKATRSRRFLVDQERAPRFFYELGSRYKEARGGGWGRQIS